jgi:hypothetical protein
MLWRDRRRTSTRQGAGWTPLIVVPGNGSQAGFAEVLKAGSSAKAALWPPDGGIALPISRREGRRVVVALLEKACAGFNRG